MATIQHRNDFLAASANGCKFVVGSFILQMNERKAGHPYGESQPRFGFTVTKKMGNAVIRNRIKRRLREAVAKAALPHAVTNHDYVIISRHKAIDCPFSELVRDMEFAFSRITTMKKKPSNQPKA